MLSISRGNVKMGSIPSISLPVGKTCRPDAPCYKKCYARRMEYRFEKVKSAYQNNLDLWNENPYEFEMQAVLGAFMSSVFRWHVSGDIPDMEYLRMMCRVALKCKNTKFFAFTKKYELVNAYLKEGNKIPRNLKIIFSAWEGLNIENPFHFPEAHVVKKDGTTTAPKIKNVCTGKCTECALHGRGCWTMKKGEYVIFKEH